MDDYFDYTELTDIVMGDEKENEPNTLTSVIKVPYKKKETDEYDWESDVYGVFSIIDYRQHKVIGI